ncbi:MAG: FAD-binding protein, partial [Firmicutes bacterium]|nr:FAD-binding protein [Bacillota bacterium]
MIMNFDGLKERIKGEVLFDAPMKKYTTYKIGGPADCLILAADGEDIAAAITFAKEREIPYMVIGNGSNLLVRDGGIEGIVIRIGEGMNSFTLDGILLTAQSGCILSRMAKETAKRGLKGIEWAAGIPASLGGAAYMNAGAYGHFFYETLEAVEIVDENAELKVLKKEELEYSYRHTSLMDRKAIVTKVMIRLVEGDAASLMESVDAT